MLGRAAENDVYIPHPSPKDEIVDDENMGLWSLLKTLIIPALISLILYLIISYAIVPLWKRYRGRYSTYLPLDSISTRTTSLRHRIQTAVFSRLIPSTWRRDFGGERYTVSAQDGAGSDFDDEDGEELYDIDDGHREALSLDARRGRDLDGRRLSRDLEEGFKDDSDDEDDLPNTRHGRNLSR
ncbi:uncharacterized protein LY89DRAFT_470393 [Mollisia scopiformis]|uniref:Uncharacterized protein n=1 Tax=Mollisia scopiformis TaxID=149040 RepID=A0A194XJW9_MOLSC|nr:uncharacterized protein LY89DRAFT_470393 [Mollisia scopiformis]KUJ20082.1 hypothetical protein LY89DRAFT_470393 [Mollisia scopiformis]